MYPEKKHPPSRSLSDAGKRMKPSTGCAAQQSNEASTVESSTRYVRLPELRRMVPWSPATIWRQSKNPASRFPKPIKLSERVTAWNRAAVEAFLAEREAV